MGPGGLEGGERGSRRPVETRNTEMRMTVYENMCGSVCTCIYMHVYERMGVQACAHLSVCL